MDRQLVTRLKEKEQKALEEIIETYTSLVVSIIQNISRGSLSKEDVEDTVVEVFLTLWNNTDRIIDDKLKGYLCSIARTKALTRIASVRKHSALDIDEVEMEDDFLITSEVEKKEIVSALRDIISGLNMPEKEIVIRYYYYSQTIAQIAKVMQINPETVKTKLRRTREKIKMKLAERGFAP